MDVGLNSRTVSIIRSLLESPTPASVAGLCEQLRCTRRMVRYCLPDVEAWLASRGVTFVRGRQRGMRLEANAGLRQRLLSELTKQNPYALKLSTDQRRSILSVLLVSATAPRTIEQMAKIIGVSRTTVQKDLSFLNTRMSQKYGLTLRSIRGRGVTLAGTEGGFRQAMVDSVMESVKDSGLSRLLQDIERANAGPAPQHGQNAGLLDLVFRDLRSTNLEFLKSQILAAESALGREFSETARVALLVHLAIAVGRLKSGHDIAMAPEHLESLRALTEYEVASDMAQRIGDRFQVAVPEAEVGYMTLHLAGAKRGLGNREVIVGNSEVAMKTIIREMVKEAERQLSRKLSDRKLLEGLLLHLVPAYYRVRYSLPIRNPLLQEIKADYPDLFEAALRAAGVFRKALGVELPEEEVAYIAIHLGAAVERIGRWPHERPKVMVLCASGIGTATLLASRLESEFPRIDIVGVQSALEISSKSLSGVDAIISTVPVSIPGLPCVTVSPTLSKEDCELVSNLFSVLPVSRRILRKTAATPASGVMPFEKRAVRFNTSAEDWVEAVTAAGQVLVELGFCEPRYVRAMVDKIQRFGGYVVLGNGVALPHASPSDGVIEPGLSLVRLAHPVVFPGRPSDPVVLVIGVSATRDTSEEMMHRLNVVLSGPGLDCLKKAKHEQDFAAELASLVSLRMKVRH